MPLHKLQGGKVIKPQHHLYVSTAAAGVLYLVTNSFLSSLGCILSGVFIDIDHFLEFFLFSNEKLSPSNFVKFYANIRYKKAYVLFHSYELIVIVWYFTVKSGNNFFFGISIGYTLHLFFDLIYNPVFWQGYSLLYRIFSGFSKKKFIDEDLHYKKYPPKKGS